MYTIKLTQRKLENAEKLKKSTDISKPNALLKEVRNDFYNIHSEIILLRPQLRKLEDSEKKDNASTEVQTLKQWLDIVRNFSSIIKFAFQLHDHQFK
ncbi:unnamed protein product [Schistosoma turkestanicum]|nr:unnamed protein product [Schistosoma turkestanicum]